MKENKKVKVNIVTHLSDTLHLVEGHDGFWLYDDTRSMNLAMSERTKDDALVKTLSYYQIRLKEVETKYTNLRVIIYDLIDKLIEVNNDEFCLSKEDERC